MGAITWDMVITRPMMPMMRCLFFCFSQVESCCLLTNLGGFCAFFLATYIDRVINNFGGDAIYNDKLQESKTKIYKLLFQRIINGYAGLMLKSMKQDN